MWILEILGIVMAGWRGERLYPPTKDRVKAAVPFGGAVEGQGGMSCQR
jgi:ADP-glucose pyrophosphorylase